MCVSMSLYDFSIGFCICSDSFLFFNLLYICKHYCLSNLFCFRCFFLQNQSNVRLHLKTKVVSTNISRHMNRKGHTLRLHEFTRGYQWVHIALSLVLYIIVCPLVLGCVQHRSCQVELRRKILLNGKLAQPLHSSSQLKHVCQLLNPRWWLKLNLIS